jgi:hypothetical protein
MNRLIVRLPKSLVQGRSGGISRIKVLVSDCGNQECRSLINLRDALRRALGWILLHHPKDEIHKFLRNPFSAHYPAGFGDNTPRERES